MKKRFEKWKLEFYVSLSLILLIVICIAFLILLSEGDFRNIILNLMTELIGIFITLILIDVFIRRREQRGLKLDHIIRVKNTVDYFQSYLEDISKTLDELNKDNDDKVIFERLKWLLLNINKKSVFQFFVDENIVSITGTAVSILSELETKFRGVNDFQSLCLTRKDIVLIRKNIHCERMKLVIFRRELEKGTYVL
ncbi:MAG: hypothetical protein AB7V16_13965 [Vulcanibacillus sp.]